MVEGLKWLGHASFRWEGSKTVYFDPWKLAKNSKKADFIFITHEHFDHFSLEDVKLISTKETVIIAESSVSRQLRAKEAYCKEIKALLPGDNIEIAGVKINAVRSYNTNKEFHTKGSKKLGFIVEMDGIKVYHAGDTDNIPEMQDYRCDIALLPVSGTYVMTADEAVEAALAINPRVAIPIHYADIVGTQDDAGRFQRLLKGRVEVKILKKES